MTVSFGSVAQEAHATAAEGGEQCLFRDIALARSGENNLCGLYFDSAFHLATICLFHATNIQTSSPAGTYLVVNSASQP